MKQIVVSLALLLFALGADAAPKRAKAHPIPADPARFLDGSIARTPAEPAATPAVSKTRGTPTAEYCEAAECGSLPTTDWPSIYGFNNETTECKAIKVTSKEKCLERCNCNWNANVKKCNRRLHCLDIASGELHACQTQCEIDFT